MNAAQLKAQAQAGAEHYTRAVKLRLGGCLASGGDVPSGGSAPYSVGVDPLRGAGAARLRGTEAELAKYSQGSLSVTRRKLLAVSALASAMRTVINGAPKCCLEPAEVG